MITTVDAIYALQAYAGFRALHVFADTVDGLGGSAREIARLRLAPGGLTEDPRQISEAVVRPPGILFGLLVGEPFVPTHPARPTLVLHFDDRWRVYHGPYLLWAKVALRA